MKKGFTLVELSIVLVIIGLIIGGVLVGQDLINAAMVRAQITQIEKYQSAVNTFRSKYGYLPGDIPDPAATQFGFASRGTWAGQGNGDGILQGSSGVGAATIGGETSMFWDDLTYAHGANVNMIEGSFSGPDNYMTTLPNSIPSISIATMNTWVPQAKVGNGNYVYVWSGGWQFLVNWMNVGDGANYFALSSMLPYPAGAGGFSSTTVSLSVKQAYAIDKKIDDGLPQSGRVMAMFPGANVTVWASGGPNNISGETNSGDYDSPTGAPIVNASDIGDGMAAGPLSCYDGASGLPEKYSMGQNGGSGLNCALSFRFQ